MTPEPPIEAEPPTPVAHRSAAPVRANAGDDYSRLRGLSSAPAARWLLLLIVVAAAVSVLTACGSLNAPGFSGGGVPIGGSRVAGRVVAAASPSTSLPGVQVQVQATPQGGTTSSLHATTAEDGSFSFSNVLPGFSNGTVAVTATPTGSNYQSQQISFTVADGHMEQMIITLPPASFDPSTAKSLSIGVASPAVPTGGSVQVQAVLRDAAGKPISMMPSLVFDGNFGSLAPDGTLSIPAGILSGSGTITAYWYNLPPQSQQIHVDPNASQSPPSPPVLPTDGKVSGS